MTASTGLSRTGTMVWHELLFPARLDAQPVVDVLRVVVTRQSRGLLLRADPLVLETIGTSGGVHWGLGTSHRETAWLLPQLRAQVSGLRLERLDVRPLPVVNLALELRLNAAGRSLRTDTPEVTARALLTALADVHGNEAAVLSWLIGPSLWRPVVKGPSTQPGGLLARLVFRPPDREEIAALKVKHEEPLLAVAGWIGVRAEAQPRQRQVAGRVLSALQLARQPGVGLATRLVSSSQAVRRLSGLVPPALAWPCPFNTEEFATVLGWPIGNPMVGMTP